MCSCPLGIVRNAFMTNKSLNIVRQVKKRQSIKFNPKKKKKTIPYTQTLHPHLIERKAKDSSIACCNLLQQEKIIPS